MSLVLDTGALIAFERGNRDIAALVKTAREDGTGVVTSAGCVAQAWRGSGSSRALLARLLNGVDERALDRNTSRRVGELCGRTYSTDVVDAHLAVIASDNDVVVTSDVTELRKLLRARGSRAFVQRC